MFAGKNNLHNLTAIIDRNNIQIDGFTEEIMPIEPLADKFKAFNWTVIEVDGHNHREIVDAFNKAMAIFENPTVIIAHTIPGKGWTLWNGILPGTVSRRRRMKRKRRWMSYGR